MISYAEFSELVAYPEDIVASYSGSCGGRSSPDFGNNQASPPIVKEEERNANLNGSADERQSDDDKERIEEKPLQVNVAKKLDSYYEKEE